LGGCSCAGKHRLTHLTAIVDYNKVQSAGPTREIQDLEPLADKWRAFGSPEEVDGHDVAALRSLFRRLPFASDRPSTIICHTVKGKVCRSPNMMQIGTTKPKFLLSSFLKCVPPWSE
jgi:transketolase